MSLHHDINAMRVRTGSTWIEACEILASAKEAAEQARPTMVRNDLTGMIAKLGVIETDAAATLSIVQEAKRLLEARLEQIERQSVDILASLPQPNPSQSEAA